MPRDTPSARLRRETVIGLSCAFLTLLIWAGFTIITRHGATTTLAPVDLAFLRFAVSGAIVAPWAIRYGFGGVAWPRMLALAVTAGLGFGLLAFSGFTFAPAAHGAALMPGVLPLWTAGLAALMLGERFGPLKTAGLVLVLGGIACIAAESVLGDGLEYWRGDALFLAASLSWALYTVAARAWNIRPMQAAAIVYVVSVFLYLPVYFLFLDGRLFAAPIRDIVVHGIYQGALATVVSIVLFTRAVVALGAASTTMVTSAVPGVVTIAAIPLLDEIPSRLTVAGVCLVSAGVIATVFALRVRSA
ncbi:MAG TPA: DMT family transporter [Alphaproteobacteria bacterium]|nr:DMT family transporter [Alphaproteobacteria bacterium]